MSARGAPLVVWHVEDSEPAGLVELLGRLKHAAALAEGRVFVDGRRASSTDTQLSPGQKIEVFAERPQQQRRPVVLGRRAELVVVDKPSGVPSEPDRQGVSGSLCDLLAPELGVAASDLHVVTRLDLGVSGAVLVAAGSTGRKLAVELREAGRLKRRYLTISAGMPQPPSGQWNGPVLEPGRRGKPRSATTDYRSVAAGDRTTALEAGAESGFIPSLLALAPATGRTHQLRIHAAQAGCPILGDRRYGGPTRLRLPGAAVVQVERVALHSCSVELGFADGPWRVNAPVADDLARLWTALGGAATDLEDTQC